MKHLFFVFLLVPTLAWSSGDRIGNEVRSIRSTNDPLPMPSLTLAEISMLKTSGTLVLRESDIPVPHVIRGVRYEMLSAVQVINYKIASAIQYGIKVAARDPSQTCDGTKMCVVLVLTGRATKKKTNPL